LNDKYRYITDLFACQVSQFYSRRFIFYTQKIKGYSFFYETRCRWCLKAFAEIQHIRGCSSVALYKLMFYLLTMLTAACYRYENLTRCVIHEIPHLLCVILDHLVNLFSDKNTFSLPQSARNCVSRRGCAWTLWNNLQRSPDA